MTTESPAGTPGGEIIDGEVIGPGVLCPQFRLDSGEDISLEALPEGLHPLQPGLRLRLTGEFVRVSRCMQGRGFRVSGLTDPPPAPED